MFTKSSVIILLVLFIAFYFKGLSLDPDLGWHLATGNYILTKGFPLTDPFSYTMPSYPIVTYEWLVDCIFVGVFHVSGIVGLSIFVSIIALLSLWLQLPKQKEKMVIPLFLTGSILLFVFGIRPQVFSWLLFSLLVVILKSSDKRKFIFLPVIFLIWANMHGSFILGLGIVAIYIGIQILIYKKHVIPYMLTGIACLLVTLINPYGMRLWEEILAIVFWAEKHTLLLDWYPGLLVPYIPLWIMFFLSIFFLFKYKSQYTLFEKITFFALYIVGMAAVIDIPYVAIFSLPLMVKGFSLYKKEKKRRIISKGFTLLVVAIVIIHGLLLFYQRPYPEAAVMYIKQHSSTGNVFTDFNWGGYLLWNLPQKKVFIDGQMTHWKSHELNIYESTNAFQEYLLVVNKKITIDTLSKKYNIDTVVLPQGSAIAETLQQDEWAVLYQDKTAVVYRKKVE